VDVCEMEDALERVAALINSGQGGYVCAANVHMVMEAFDDPAFARAVNAADLVVADGKPIALLQRRMGSPGARQVRGPDLMCRLIAEAERRGWAIGFYGSRPATLQAMADRAAREFPHLKISYLHSPPFGEIPAESARAEKAAISGAAIDLLFVGLGCPKQEKWMAANAADLRPAVLAGVGAGFDFYAGTVRAAPRWMQKAGFEWLFRLMSEPRRLWRRYLILNPRFLVLAAKQLLGRK
jgi:N-acetylglucosaminyldiphosphoundecaprenol N-acetyl-beta-D-mannosaminyltransferase